MLLIDDDLWRVRRPGRAEEVRLPLHKLRGPSMSHVERAAHAAGGGRAVSRSGGQSFHFRTNHVGKATHAAGTAAAHQRYIERPGAVELDRDGFISIGNLGETEQERREFWNRAEQNERINGRVQQRFVAEFPHELSPEGRRAVLEEFAREFERRGLPYHAVAHVPDKHGDARNFHAHIVFSDRPAERVGRYDWTFAAKKDRELNSKDFPRQQRERWAEIVNRQLVREGHTKRLDPRSYAEQGIAKEAERHMGPKVSARERKGQPSRLAAENQARRESYQEIAATMRDYLRDRAQDQARRKAQEVALTAERTPSRSPLADQLRQELERDREQLVAVKARLDALYAERREHQRMVQQELRRPIGRAKWAEAKLEELRGKQGNPLNRVTPDMLSRRARKAFDAYQRRAALYERAESAEGIKGWYLRRKARAAHRALREAEAGLFEGRGRHRQPIGDHTDYRQAVAYLNRERSISRLEQVAQDARAQEAAIKERHAPRWAELEQRRESAAGDRQARRELEARIKRTAARLDGLEKWSERDEQRGYGVAGRGDRQHERQDRRPGEAVARRGPDEAAPRAGADHRSGAGSVEREPDGLGTGAAEAGRAGAAATPAADRERERPAVGGGDRGRARDGLSDELRNRLRRVAGHDSGQAVERDRADDPLARLRAKYRPGEREHDTPVRGPGRDHMHSEGAVIPDQQQDPIARYVGLERELQADFKARQGRPATPAEINARDRKLTELGRLALEISKDRSLADRAREAGLDRSIRQRVDQSRPHGRDRGIER